MIVSSGKTKSMVLSLILLAAIAGGFSIYYYLHHLTYISTDDAYIEGRTYTVAPKIPGTAQKVWVDHNQSVKKGDLLVEIDPADYEVKVNESQAALNAEQSRVANAQAALNTTQANLEMQQANFKQAELDLTRAQKLVKEGALAQERLDRAQTAHILAQAQVKTAQEQIAQAKTAVDLEMALVKQKEATLKIAQLNLSYSKIYSPADGYVTKKSVEAGNQIQAGQPLMAVVALNDIWIVANYKETQLKNVRRGQRVLIKVDTYPKKIFSGKVDSLMAGTGAAFSLFPPENALGNYVKVVQRVPVKIIFDNPNQDRYVLRVGMSVVPTIVTRDE